MYIVKKFSLTDSQKKCLCYSTLQNLKNLELLLIAATITISLF